MRTSEHYNQPDEYRGYKLNIRFPQCSLLNEGFFAFCD